MNHGYYTRINMNNGYINMNNHVLYCIILLFIFILVSMLFPMALHAWLLQLASVAPKASSVRALADLRRSTAKSKGPSPRRRSRSKGCNGGGKSLGKAWGNDGMKEQQM